MAELTLNDLRTPTFLRVITIIIGVIGSIMSMLDDIKYFFAESNQFSGEGSHYFFPELPSECEWAINRVFQVVNSVDLRIPFLDSAVNIGLVYGAYKGVAVYLEPWYYLYIFDFVVIFGVVLVTTGVILQCTPISFIASLLMLVFSTALMGVFFLPLYIVGETITGLKAEETSERG